MRTRTYGDVETWRCDACGAYTDEPLQVCSECQARRLETPTTAKRKKTKIRANARQGESAGLKGSKKKSRSPKAKVSEASQVPESIVDEKPISTVPDVQIPEPTPREQPEPFEMNEPQGEPFQGKPSTEPEDELPSRDAEVVETEPIQTLETEADIEVHEEPAKASSVIQQPNYGSKFGDRLSLVFVNTPAPELIKRKIEVDFETFQTVSIGRSPENVVVIPDGGVSRTHAELKREENRVVLTDLKSSNGTYLYDGKEFHKVEGSVDLAPNSLIKLGTGTILRVVTEHDSSDVLST